MESLLVESSEGRLLLDFSECRDGNGALRRAIEKKKIVVDRVVAALKSGESCIYPGWQDDIKYLQTLGLIGGGEVRRLDECSYHLVEAAFQLHWAEYTGRLTTRLNDMKNAIKSAADSISRANLSFRGVTRAE